MPYRTCASCGHQYRSKGQLRRAWRRCGYYAYIPFISEWFRLLLEPTSAIVFCPECGWDWEPQP